jgi:ferredoxin
MFRWLREFGPTGRVFTVSKPPAALNLALQSLASMPMPSTRPTFEADGGLSVGIDQISAQGVRHALAQGHVRANRFTCRLDPRRFQRFDTATTKRGILINLIDPDASSFLQLFWALKHADVVRATAHALHEAFDAKVRLALPAHLPTAWMSSLEGVRHRVIEPRYPVAHHRLLPRAANYFRDGTVLVLDAIALIDLAYAAQFAKPNPRRPVALIDQAGTTYRVVDRASDLHDIAGPGEGEWFAGPRLTDKRPEAAAVGDGELVFYREPEARRFASACIRCSACIRICPTHCDPVALLDASNEDDAPLAARAGLPSCIECGLCTAACPSAIELHHIFSALRARLPGDLLDRAGGVA